MFNVNEKKWKNKDSLTRASSTVVYFFANINVIYKQSLFWSHHMFLDIWL